MSDTSWILVRSVPSHGFFQRQSFDSKRLQGPILEKDYSEMASFGRCESGQSSASSLFDSIGTLTCVLTALFCGSISPAPHAESYGSFPT